MTVVPCGKTFPAGTPVRVITTHALQLSVAVAFPSVASLTTAVQLGPAATVTSGGTVSTGAVWSAEPGESSTVQKVTFIFATMRSLTPSQLRSIGTIQFGCQCELMHVGP